MCKNVEDCTSYNYIEGEYYAYTYSLNDKKYVYTKITESEQPEYLHLYNSMYYPVRMNTATQIVDIETGKYS